MNIARRICPPALIAIAAAQLVACGQEATDQPNVVRPVQAIRVADVNALMERTFTGRASAEQEVNLSFRVSGPLLAFPVQVGDQVKAGDVIVRMDPEDFETALRTVQGQLEREVARATRAEADLARLEKARKQDPGAIAETWLA